MRAGANRSLVCAAQEHVSSECVFAGTTEGRVLAWPTSGSIASASVGRVEGNVRAVFALPQLAGPVALCEDGSLWVLSRSQAGGAVLPVERHLQAPRRCSGGKVVWNRVVNLKGAFAGTSVVLSLMHTSRSAYRLVVMLVEGGEVRLGGEHEVLVPDGASEVCAAAFHKELATLSVLWDSGDWERLSFALGPGWFSQPPVVSGTSGLGRGVTCAFAVEPDVLVVGRGGAVEAYDLRSGVQVDSVDSGLPNLGHLSVVADGSMVLAANDENVVAIPAVLTGATLADRILTLRGQAHSGGYVLSWRGGAGQKRRRAEDELEAAADAADVDTAIACVRANETEVRQGDLAQATARKLVHTLAEQDTPEAFEAILSILIGRRAGAQSETHILRTLVSRQRWAWIAQALPHCAVAHPEAAAHILIEAVRSVANLDHPQTEQVEPKKPLKKSSSSKKPSSSSSSSSETQSPENQTRAAAFLEHVLCLIASHAPPATALRSSLEMLLADDPAPLSLLASLLAAAASTLARFSGTPLSLAAAGLGIASTDDALAKVASSSSSAAAAAEDEEEEEDEEEIFQRYSSGGCAVRPVLKATEELIHDLREKSLFGASRAGEAKHRVSRTIAAAAHRLEEAVAAIAMPESDNDDEETKEKPSKTSSDPKQDTDQDDSDDSDDTDDEETVVERVAGPNLWPGPSPTTPLPDLDSLFEVVGAIIDTASTIRAISLRDPAEKHLQMATYSLRDVLMTLRNINRKSAKVYPLLDHALRRYPAPEPLENANVFEETLDLNLPPVSSSSSSSAAAAAAASTPPPAAAPGESHSRRRRRNARNK